MKSSGVDLEFELSGLLETLLLGMPPKLNEAMKYAVLSPGKRLRPRIALETAALLELLPKVALPSALSLEIFHAFTLVHDDLPCMDDDDERRGRPSTHIAHGEAIALLAGDALALLAARAILLTPHEIPRDRVAIAVARLLDLGGGKGVIGGQALEFSEGAVSNLSSIRTLHHLKTGALFEAAFLLPLDLAGFRDGSAEERALRSLAMGFGSAFQVKDDLDDEAKGEAHSILRYQPREEAWKEALAAFHGASSEVSLLFGARAGRLLAFLSDAIGVKT